jgi:dihydroneopterin aldolase
MKINISALTFDTIIGILPQERCYAQEVAVDIEFEYEYKKDNFIDYAEVKDRVKETLIDGEFGLLEDAILSIEKELRVLFGIEKSKIKITKPDILADAMVSVSNY